MINKNNQGATIDQALRKQKIVLQALAIRQDRSHDTVARIESLAREYHTTPSTVYRWLNVWQQGGLDALIRKPFGGKGRVRSFDPAAVAYLRELVKQNPHAGAKEHLRELQTAAAGHGWRIGSVASYYRLYDKIMKDLYPREENPEQSADTQPAQLPDAILKEIKDGLPALSGLPLEDILNIRDYLLYVINKNNQSPQK